jgi:hypothetical protein
MLKKVKNFLHAQKFFKKVKNFLSPKLVKKTLRKFFTFLKSEKFAKSKNGPKNT